MWNPFRRSLVKKHARDISGDAWLNITALPDAGRQAVLAHAPLHFATELSGIVTLIHFWDYSSPDSVEDLSHLRTWWDMYKGPHFMIIGIHTPQYEFGKYADKVQSAILRFHLDYPMVNDSQHTTWKRYGSRGLPRKILVDAQGVICFDHWGKGGQDLLETKIYGLLDKVKEGHQFVYAGNSVTPSISMDRETMSAKGIAVSPLTDPAEYHIPSTFPLHGVALSGWWVTGTTELMSGPLNDSQSCSIHFFGSKSAVTMRALNDTEATVQIFIDNKKIGEDITIRESKDYLLASGLSVGPHHLTIIPIKGNIAIASVSFS
jgi:hypothetical protein